MNIVRRATTADIPRILELLVQVCMVHHNGRPDLFKGPATKYNAEELEKIVSTAPRFSSMHRHNSKRISLSNAPSRY